jgi:FixJ family two-component response regulator
MSPKRAAPTGSAPPRPGEAKLSDGATIFLVEQDDAVRDALAMSLRAAGHRVEAFGSGRQFLAAYRPGNPGCLVADADLSDPGAAALLGMLTTDHVTLPAVITSRYLKRRPPADGLPPGPILFLDKPFGIGELLRLIRMALAQASNAQPGR